jgi:hypothetical protein
MHRVSPDFRLSDYHHEVGRLWRSRNDEPEKQEFDKLPPWMDREQDDIDTRLDLQKIFPKIFETLGPKESKVLKFRFWADMTLEDCGHALNVTRERIRQIEAAAIRKMNSPHRFAMMQGYQRRTYRMRVKEQPEEKDWTWLEDIIKRQKQRQEDELIKKMYDQRAIKWRT